MIILTVPASVMGHFAELIYKYADIRAFIGVVPGTGGSECYLKKSIEQGNVFFGIERVPAIARLIKKGSCVKSVGYRGELHVAAIPHSHSGHCASLIEDVFDIPCITIKNYLSLSLTPSNPILHTVRLRSLFEDWHEGIYYDRVPLFYEEWDNKSSELLILCDEELRCICDELKRIIPDINVKTLREHYESYTIDEMTRKISSIKAFKGLTSPVIKKEKGLIPDLSSRYFTSDFPFGLSIIEQVGDMTGLELRNIKETMEWYRNIASDNREFRFSDFGITDVESLADYYMK